ncbi:MAG: SHOCT domain-containing protein [Clostridia bacterium]|nr:SHOCT domain-containing protein [Clostridia bacterium]
MKEKDNELVKQMMLEEIIVNAIQIPGVKVNRKQFLADQFATKADNLEEILAKGPIAAGIKREDLLFISKKLIITRTSQSSIASFVAGIPGGLAMAATIPADILQFFGMALRLAQELSYLYGAQDLWVDGKIDDERIKNQLILYCGVMFGVSGAVSGVRVLSTQLSKTALKKIPQYALTKTFWYPIIKKTANFIGISLTKKTFAQGVSKAVPVIGGVISGGINFASMMPMATRLNDTLDKATFNYTDEEFNKDIEIIMTIDENGEVEVNEEPITKKFSKGIKTTTEGFSKFVSKIGKKDNPYEELEKLKGLLDKEIITKEEFEMKKKQLLNL